MGVERRDLLKASGIVLSGAVAGCGSQEEGRTENSFDQSSDFASSTASGRGSAALRDAEQLKQMLEGDRSIDFEGRSLFVGNPNSYDAGLSGLELRGGEGFVEQGLEQGLSPEQVVEDFYFQRHGELPQDYQDEIFFDPLDHDIVVGGELDFLVLDSSGLDYVGSSAERAVSEIEDVAGLNIDLEVRDFPETERERMMEVSDRYPDSMVVHTYDNGESLGASAPDKNLSLINYSQVTGYPDTETALAKTIGHEARHAMFSSPHLIYPGNNLMSMSTAVPGDAQETPQTRELIKRYVSSQPEYEVTEKDGSKAIEAQLEPQYRIKDGEEYLGQNTENLLRSLGFPVEQWNIETDEDTATMRRDDVEILLEPHSRHGYENLEIR